MGASLQKKVKHKRLITNTYKQFVKKYEFLFIMYIS